MKPLASFIATLVLSASVALGAPPSSRPAAAGHTPDKAASDGSSVTEHELKIGDRVLKYRATAGYLTLKDEQGKPRANFFNVAYEKLDESNAAKRPITFVFNGGPGAASVWLHLGALGPRRVALRGEEGFPPTPPYHLVDNPDTWLDLTDLVFVDPIGTGYSRPAKGEKPQQFFGVREDISAMADFIRLYLTTHERWLSPKFLAGESYGTTRAAGLSQYLSDQDGIALNGIVLISTVLNFQTLSPSDGNDLPYPLYLPSYTAIAHYHKRLEPDLQKDLSEALKQSEQFAMGDYARALALGSSLPPDEREKVVRQLSRFTALPAEWLRRNNLRVSPTEFRKELLTDRRLILGRFDARITGYDAHPNSPYAEYDPSLAGYRAVYTATFNDYVRRELKYDNDLPYEVLTSVGPWRLNDSGYTNLADDLQRAMTQLPHLHVMVAAGRYDLATPYLAADYTVNHLLLSPELRQNIKQTYYPGGHMLYHNLQALDQLKSDARAFIEGAVGNP